MISGFKPSSDIPTARRQWQTNLPERTNLVSIFRIRTILASFLRQYEIEKGVGLTGFVIIHVLIASFSPAQGEHNQMLNTEFFRTCQ